MKLRRPSFYLARSKLMTRKLAVNYYDFLAVAGFFFGVGLCHFSAYKIFISRNADQWRETKGRIVKSEVVKVPDHPSQPNVVYAYEVDGERFASNEIAFLNVTGGALADETAARYPLGEIVSVYYDPGDPAKSVLEPQLSAVAYFMLAAGVLCLGV